ncbi:CZB domain-containing protein [Hymenobacter sp. B81]|uniref:CZB domain-containing protein n=1 Tax=Hymenobacter sp. B81 TaxID=3344878 RepID=UPI0037DC3E82
MDITSLDFQQARIKQVLFKSRLRSVLYGVREADEALFSVQQNPFGQWLRTVAAPQYGGRPELRELERTLQRMLDTGRELVAQYRRGQIEEARAGLERIDAFAAQMEDLLQKLETRVGY